MLVVDDHAVVRQGVAAILGAQGRGTEVLQAHGGADALALAARTPGLDLVLVDLQLPDTVGMSLLVELGRRFPGLPVVVLSASEAVEDVRRAIALGALAMSPSLPVPQRDLPRSILS